MDVSILVSFLAPFLPFLIKVGEQASEEAGKQLGSDAWAKAKKIWEKLQPKVDNKPIQEAITDVASQPEDADFQAALRVQLKKMLNQDTDLSNELDLLMQRDSLDTASTTKIEQRITGDRNKTVGKVDGNVSM
ncbi:MULTISPECIES: hypothetical protein [unclassified Microcoleus]|uniref:hypothetical protein n=1 Tax=unclassified Microcoleus TaxID=2642155 RepID=UPI00312B31AF